MGSVTFTQQPSSQNTILYPVRTGCTDEFEKSGCTENWQCVDDEIDDIDINDYVWTDSDVTKHTFVKLDHTIKEYTTVNYVQLCYVLKSQDYSLAWNSRVQSCVSEPGELSEPTYGRNFNLITGYRTYRDLRYTNPKNGQPWDWLDFAKIHMGLAVSSPSIQLHTFTFRPYMDGDIDVEDSYPEGTEHWEAVRDSAQTKFVSESRPSFHEDTYYVSVPSEKQYTYFTTGIINNWGSGTNLFDGDNDTWALAGDDEICTMKTLSMDIDLTNFIAPIKNVRMRAFIAPAALYAPAIGCATDYDYTASPDEDDDVPHYACEADINVATGKFITVIGCTGFQARTILWNFNHPNNALSYGDSIDKGSSMVNSVGIIGDYAIIGGRTDPPTVYDISSGTFHEVMSFPTSDEHVVGSGGHCHVCDFEDLSDAMDGFQNFDIVGEYVITTSDCCEPPKTPRIHVWRFNSEGTTPETMFEYITRYSADIGYIDAALYENDPTKVLIFGDRVLVFDTITETISQVSDTVLNNDGDQWSDGRYIWDKKTNYGTGIPGDIDMYVWEVNVESSTVTLVDTAGESEGWWYKGSGANWRIPVSVTGIPCGDCVVGLQHTNSDGEGDNLLIDVLYLDEDKKIQLRCRNAVSVPAYNDMVANPLATNGYSIWTAHRRSGINTAYNLSCVFDGIPEEQMDCDSAPTGEFTLQPYFDGEGYGNASTTTDIHYGWTDWIDLGSDPKAPTEYWNFSEVRNLKAKIIGTNVACSKIQLEIDQDYYSRIVNEVKLFGRFGNEYGACGSEYACFKISNPTYGDDSTCTEPHELSFPGTLYSASFPSLPDGVTKWSLNDVVNSKFGFSLKGDTCEARCDYFYITVELDVPFSPEVKCAAMYLNVNHTPEEVACDLNKPETVSFNHSRNVMMLNFWSGNRAVYDLSRSGKTVVLKGKEFDRDKAGCKIDSTCSYPDRDACERLQCIDNMGRDGNPIVLSGFSFTPWNKTYRLLSFGYKKIQSCPALFEYIIELEELY